jgi:surface protein
MPVFKPLTKEELKTAIKRWCENEIEAKNIYGDSNNWDVSNVTNMSYMFHNIKFNGDISKWNVSNVTDMIFMFSFSKFNGDISKWDVSNVTDMRCMFYNSKFNGDISKWDVSKVIDMSYMFGNSKFNGDISKWDVSNVTDMRYMFMLSKFNSNISNWDVLKVKNMSQMFYNSEFNGDLTNWNLNSLIYGKEEILKYINKKWKEQKVKYEELMCNVYYDKIDSKYIKCETCKNVFDEIIKEEWIINHSNCPMCRSEWKNNTIYAMANE